MIFAVEGKPVKDMSDLQYAISNESVGRAVTLKVRRGSGTVEVPVTLANRPHSLPG